MALTEGTLPPQQQRHFFSQLSASSLVVRKLGVRGGGGAVFILHRMSAHRTTSRQAMEGGGERSFSLFRMPGTVCTHSRSMMVPSVATYYGWRAAVICVPPLGFL